MDSESHVGMKCASAIKANLDNEILRRGFKMQDILLYGILYIFLLFTLLIKSSTAHIDVQTKPPVLILRRLRPVHINMIWRALSVQSQHRPIRGLPLWVGGERVMMAQEDLSLGVLMKL